MAFVAIFLASWTAFFLFADRSKWREYAPACLLAMVLSISTDVIVSNYHLWTYYDPTNLIPINHYTHFLDDLGIYPVVTYLFLQYYPSHQKTLRKVLYFFYWTLGAIALEFLHHRLGIMEHSNLWSHIYSYVSDWLLLYVLLFFHQVYNRQLVPVAQDTTSESDIPAYIQYARSLGMDMEFLAQRDDYEIYMVEIHAGGTIPLHQHSNTEYILVLRGEMDYMIGNQPGRATQGMIVNFPGDVPHQASNHSQASTLLLGVYAPHGLEESLVDKTYEDLVTSVPIRL